jgi:hypothetical protein
VKSGFTDTAVASAVSARKSFEWLHRSVQ